MIKKAFEKFQEVAEKVSPNKTVQAIIVIALALIFCSMQIPH